MWECQKCGRCCRNIAVKMFLPNFWDEKNQCCKHITEDNICSIYPDRPDVCRVPKGINPKIACDILRRNE